MVQNSKVCLEIKVQQERLFIAYTNSENLLRLSRTILQALTLPTDDAQQLTHFEKAVSKAPTTERRNAFRTFILDLASRNPDVAECVGAFVKEYTRLLVLSDDSSQGSYEAEKDRLFAQEIEKMAQREKILIQRIEVLEQQLEQSRQETESECQRANGAFKQFRAAQLFITQLQENQGKGGIKRTISDSETT